MIIKLRKKDQMIICINDNDSTMFRVPRHELKKVVLTKIGDFSDLHIECAQDELNFDETPKTYKRAVSTVYLDSDDIVEQRKLKKKLEGYIL